MFVSKIVLIAVLGCVIGRPQNIPFLPPGFNVSSLIEAGQNIFNPGLINNNPFANASQYLNLIPGLNTSAIPAGFLPGSSQSTNVNSTQNV